MCLILGMAPKAPIDRVQGASPAVFWTSQPVRASQTVLAYGANFGTAATVTLDGQFKGTAKVAQSTDRCVEFQMNGTQQYPIVQATIAANGGTAKTWINRPALWWAQSQNGGPVLAGAAVSVFGTCLATPDSSTSVTLQVQGHKFVLKPEHADLYHFDVTLPAEAQSGPATLSVSRDGIESDPLSVSLTQKPADDPSGESSDAQAIKANGRQDDTQAVQDAINAAAQAHKVLRLPAGPIRLTAPITIPSHAGLRGEDEGRTLLIFDINGAAPAGLVNMQAHSTLSDLTVFSANYKNGIVASDGGGNVVIRHVRARLNNFMGHLKIDAVRDLMVADQDVTHGGIDSIQLHGPNCCVEDCDIDGCGMSMLLDHVSQSVIRNNNFTNGRWGWYSITSCESIIFEDNNVHGGDLMSCGGGINTQQMSQNIYYSGNKLDRFYGWDREGMTSDGPGGGYYGSIAKVDGTRTEIGGDIKGAPARWQGAGMYVLGGKGQGQYRVIGGISGRTITLETPWVVEPDSTSVVTIAPVERHYLVIGNTFTDTGIGIQFYGSSVDMIASGNHSIRTIGFTNSGRIYGGGVQPSWFVQWLDNTVEQPEEFFGEGGTSSRVEMGGIASYSMDIRMTPPAPVVLGSVIRNNTLQADGTIHLGWPNLHPNAGDLVEDSLVEGNTVKDAPIGVHVGPNCVGVLLLDNKTPGCKKDIYDERALVPKPKH